MSFILMVIIGKYVSSLNNNFSFLISKFYLTIKTNICVAHTTKTSWDKSLGLCFWEWEQKSALLCF